MPTRYLSVQARRCPELAASLDDRITVVEWVNLSTKRAHLVLRISDDEADGHAERLVSRVAGALILHANGRVKVHDSEHAARVQVALNDPLYYEVTFINAITQRPGQHERYRYNTMHAALDAAKSGYRPFNNTRVDIGAITYESPDGVGSYGYTLDRDGNRVD